MTALIEHEWLLNTLLYSGARLERVGIGDGWALRCTYSNGSQIQAMDIKALLRMIVSHSIALQSERMQP